MTDSGLSGDALLNVLIEPSSRAAIFHGARRETLANAHSILKFGYQETRAWDRRNLYLVDNSEGDIGALTIDDKWCIGIVSDHTVHRKIEVQDIIADIPVEYSKTLVELSQLPMFQREKLTAVFWSDVELLTSVEPWHRAYRAGAELLRRELMSDPEWVPEASEHYEIDNSTCAMIAGVIRRFSDRSPVTLTPEETCNLFPPEAKNRGDALELLIRGDMFRVANDTD